MARPLSPITPVLREIVSARGETPTTWRDAAHELGLRQLINPEAPAEVKLVRRTLENMKRRGDVLPAARVPVPGSRRPMTGWVTRCLPSSNGTGAAMCPTAALQSAIRGWKG